MSGFSSIFLRNTVFGGGGQVKPCLDNLVFRQGVNNSEDYTVKNVIDNTYVETKGNCKYYDSTAKSEITDNIVAYCDSISILYSLNGVDWVEWHTGDSEVQGLFNISGTTLQLGYDGNDYFTGWISRNIYTYSGNNRVVLDFTMAEGDYTESENRAYDEDIEGYLFPMSVLNSNIILNNSLKLS